MCARSNLHIRVIEQMLVLSPPNYPITSHVIWRGEGNITEHFMITDATQHTKTHVSYMNFLNLVKMISKGLSAQQGHRLCSTRFVAPTSVDTPLPFNEERVPVREFISDLAIMLKQASTLVFSLADVSMVSLML